jgi:regulator of sigma E protease
LQNGDQILKIEDVEVKVFDDGEILIEVLLKKAERVTVERNGQVVEVEVPRAFYQMLGEGKKRSFIAPAFPAVIDSIYPNMPLAESAAQPGDEIISINQQPVFAFYEIAMKLAYLKNETIEIGLLRGADTLTTTANVNSEGQLGFTADATQFLTLTTVRYNLLEAIPAGCRKAGNILRDNVRQFRLLFDSDIKGYKHVGGFGAFAQMFPRKWDWTAFWERTAFISLILAFMNFLPIPMLDGGYMMFILFEMITRRKPSDKFVEYANAVGMVFILFLLVYANGNDIYKGIFK